MKNFNTIEEYNDAYRKQMIETWETVVIHCQNWLNGERSYLKVGTLDRCKNEAYVKDKLEYANKILNNIDYYVQRNSYNYEKPKKQKDNDLSFVGYGEGWARNSVIRVPSLKRKSAWKRFYKMFPDLKGMKTITGKSSCYGREDDGKMCQQIQHDSMIKLKKYKNK